MAFNHEHARALRICTSLIVTWGDVFIFGVYFISLQVCASHMKKAEEVVTNKACQLLTEFQAESRRTTDQPFRILSIGCGDGTFDAKILQAMISKYPDVKIHYTGIDIDKDVCDKATKELGTLVKANREVDIKMLVMDFEDIDSVKDELSPYDLVLAVHAFYYMKDLRKAITDARALAKADCGKRLLKFVSLAQCYIIQLGKEGGYLQ